MTRIISIFFFTLCLFNYCVANFSPIADSSSMEKLLKQGYEDIYDFKFTKADSLVVALKWKYPNEKKVFLLLANSCWWKLRSGEDNVTNRKQFLSALQSAAALLEKRPKSELSHEELFYYIHVYSFMARLELLDDHYFKAFSLINKCSEYLFTSFGREDAYEPLFLTTGLYNYSIIAAHKKYPPLIPLLLMLPAANKSEGIKFLNRCCVSSDEILCTEGQYFLMIIYGETDINYPLSESYAEKLCNKHPSNLLYRYYFYKVLLQEDKKGLAMEQWRALYLSSTMNNQISDHQRKYFLTLAQKALEKYYLDHPSVGSKQ